MHLHLHLHMKIEQTRILNNQQFNSNSIWRVPWLGVGSRSAFYFQFQGRHSPPFQSSQSGNTKTLRNSSANHQASNRFSGLYPADTTRIVLGWRPLKPKGTTGLGRIHHTIMIRTAHWPRSRYFALGLIPA